MSYTEGSHPNITQLDINALWDWQYHVEYSSHSISKNHAMDLDVVMISMIEFIFIESALTYNHKYEVIQLSISYSFLYIYIYKFTKIHFLVMIVCNPFSSLLKRSQPTEECHMALGPMWRHLGLNAHATMGCCHVPFRAPFHSLL